MVQFSFYDRDYLRVRDFVGLRNYMDVFTRSDCFQALKLSLYYNPGFVLDTLLGWVGIANTPNWLENTAINNIVLVACSLWKYMGQNIVLFIGAIASVDPVLYEAAEIDGVNVWQRFKCIIIPSIRTIVVLNLILSVSGALSAFEMPYVVTNGTFGTSTYFVVMNKLAHTDMKVGLASAMAVVLLGIIVIVTALQKLAEKKLDEAENRPRSTTWPVCISRTRRASRWSPPPCTSSPAPWAASTTTSAPACSSPLFRRSSSSCSARTRSTPA